MKIVTDFTVSSRKPQLGAGFSPRSIFSGGEAGVWINAAQEVSIFSNTSGTLPQATPGERVARAQDLSLNNLNAIQPSFALQPILGRAPIAGRRNMMRDTENLAAWTNGDSSNPTEVYSDVEIAPNATQTADVVHFNNPAGSTSRLVTGLPVTAGQSYSVSFWAKAVEGAISTGFRVVWGARFGSASDPFDVSEQWQRFSFTRIAATSGNALSGVGLIMDEEKSISVWGWQFEPGATATPYQRVVSQFDVTEAGVMSPAYMRFDLADDILPTIIPDGGTFDVMVFGRNGSWIEREVTITAGGSLNIGPTTITGGPAGLLAALGDIVGWLAVDRSLSGTEIARLMTYHKARSAADLLETF